MRPPGSQHGEITRMQQALRPRGARRRLAKTPPTVLPSDVYDRVGTPIERISRLNHPACVHPCQRFACALADACA